MSVERRWILGVALAAVLPHLVVIGNPLLHDAPIAITGNEVVQRLPISQVWERDFWGLEPRAGTPWSGSWRPLVTLTWAAQARTLGNAPALYHAGDLAILGAAAALLFALLAELGTGRPPAAAAAALFAWHPAVTEAVASAVGRADLLAAALLLAALLAQGRGRGALALALLGASMLCKESAVSGAFVLIALAWARGEGRRTLRFQGACLGVLAAYLLVRSATLGGLGAVPMIAATDNPLVGAGTGARAAAALDLLALAARLVVAPFGLNHLYATGTIDVPRTIAALAGGTILVSLAILAWRFRDPRVWLGAALFAFPLLPALHVVSPAGVLFAERWLVLPLAGAACLAAWAVRKPTILAAIAVALAVPTVRRDLEWRSMDALVASSLRAYPGTAKVWNEKGILASNAGRHDESAAAFLEATRRAPDDPRPWFGLAGALERTGDLDGAERAWKRLLELAPANAGALWLKVARWQLGHGRVDAARATLEEAARRFPNDPAVSAAAGTPSAPR
ncbi:MAG TPA: tetratricopeptide repeat protein [Candidatus Polarisedimenticolaceae bacterium]